MAKLTLENGTVVTDFAAINHMMAALNIGLSQWPVGDAPALKALLAKNALTDEEKAHVLAGLDHYFEQLKAEAGYQSRDLIVIHPEVPNLSTMLAKFEPCHTHDDDEVRYIVDGEGIFGFVMPDGSQTELTVEAGEFINVPANTEHWFHLSPVMRTKAVRYFTGMEGWVPVYTRTPVRFAWEGKQTEAA